MSNFTLTDYLNQSCSHGTMRNQDLIPALLTWHRDVCPDEYTQLMLLPFGPIPSHAQEDDKSDWWDSDDATELCSQLFDDLDAVAPAGYYFGAHPGDGSDYGYWQHESDDETDDTTPTMAPLDDMAARIELATSLDRFRAICVSTSHITQEDNDRLQRIADARDPYAHPAGNLIGSRLNGFWVKLYDEHEMNAATFEDFSPDFRRLMWVAIAAGFRMIELDSDAATYTHLATFDW
jgi:hypothetical protein